MILQKGQSPLWCAARKGSSDIVLLRLECQVQAWYRKVREKRSPRYRRSVRLVGACHIALGETCLGAFPEEVASGTTCVQLALTYLTGCAECVCESQTNGWRLIHP